MAFARLGQPQLAILRSHTMRAKRMLLAFHSQLGLDTESLAETDGAPPRLVDNFKETFEATMKLLEKVTDLDEQIRAMQDHPVAEQLEDVTVILASCTYPKTMPCRCGHGAYYWDDGDGFIPNGRVIDDNSDGSTATECPKCGRELVAETKEASE